MLFSTVDQLYVFVLMLAAGVAVGALYDALALIRRLLEAGFFLSLAADAALGLGAAGILIVASVWANYGQLRAYMLLAAALGAALYGMGVARPAHSALRWVRRALSRAARAAGKSRILRAVFR